MLEKLQENFKKIVIILAVLVVVLLIAERLTVIPEKQVCFNDKSCLWVRVADTEKERIQGLSDKRWMHNNVGMWFVWGGESNYRGFWMKGMRFELDFLWLRNGEVVAVTRGVPIPRDDEERLAIYTPGMLVDAVLEVNAGWVERHKVEVGDALVIK